MTPIERTLSASLAGSHLAEHFYKCIVEANQDPDPEKRKPVREWMQLPINLRMALIECCGRMLLHLGPVHTNEAMAAAVFALSNDVARSDAEQSPLTVKTQNPRLRVRHD